MSFSDVCAVIDAQRQQWGGVWSMAVVLLGLLGAFVVVSAPSTAVAEEDEDVVAHLDEAALSDRARLVDEFGIDEKQVDDPEALVDIAEEARERSDEAAEEIEGMEARLEELRAAMDLLDSQVGEEALPQEARRIMLGDLAQRSAEAATTAAQVDAYQAGAEAEDELAALAEGLAASLQRVEDDDREARQRVEEAQRAHDEALERVMDLDELEEAEETGEYRELVQRQRELAEELAELTRREGEQVQRLDERRRELSEDFAEDRSRINSSIVDIPPSPREETSLEQVDPLFDEVVQARRDARARYFEHLDEKEEAARNYEEKRQLHRQAVEQVENFGDVSDDSERIQRRFAIAQLRSEIAERERKMARDVLDAHRDKREALRDRVEFYHDSVEELIPLLSRERRRAFYSLRSDDNWHDGFDSFRDAGYRIQLALQERAEVVDNFPQQLLSMTVLLWIFGFLWRCLLFPIAFFIGRRYSKRIVKFITDALLRRTFFRRHAAFTIKGGEILGALLKPALLYLGTIVVVDYVAATFPEFHILRWAIDAVFIYWMVMLAVKVLVLPRGFREGEEKAGEGSEDDESSDEIEALIELELSRARKIVLSARVVLIFWLLAHYVPALVKFATGHNVVWRIVDLLAVWGLLAVVYVVLSTWRDDIASLFGQLAGERMPRAASIVENHKNRPWGVLLIGLASVYVAGREAGRFVKSHLLDTRFSRRMANFLFRKSIELQKGEEGEDRESFESEIPYEYKQLFDDRPLVDEPFLIERTDVIERIEETFREWKKRPRNGAVAVVGEQGMGKTTLLNQMFFRWHEGTGQDVSFVRLSDKINDCAGVCEFLSEFLGLESTPDNAGDLVEAILDVPPRVLILDNCHHFFLRRIGGFEAIEMFMKIVSYTDHHHFWLLSFNGYTWSYLNRVRYRGHFFSDVVNLNGWKESEIQRMIQKRNDMDDTLSISFTELVVAHEDDEDQHYEIVRTSNGYFRLLHEFSQGNPRVALKFWLRSLRLDASSTLQVELFRRPSLQTLESLRDDYIFALAAIAQHESLRPDEIATIIHAYRGDCEMIVEYLSDCDMVEIDPVFRRARIRSLYLRSVIRRLQDANVLYT